MELSNRHKEALLSADWFAAIPEAVRNDVLAHCTTRIFAEGERVHRRGERTDCMYGILEGCLRFQGVASNERVAVLDFYGPGAWVGDVASIVGAPRMYDADAYEKTTVLILSVENLHKLLDAHPSFCRALLRLEAQRLQLVLTAIEQYSTQPLENRLAARFLMLSKPFGAQVAEGLQINLHLPQEALAQLIGSTRQRVNQILLDWEQRSIVRQKYGKTIIENLEYLQDLARQ